MQVERLSVFYPVGVFFSVFNEAYGKFAFRQTFHFNVEKAAEGGNPVQVHGWPGFRQAGSQVELPEAGGAYAEKPFRDDAGIERTFGRKMALVAFGPCFDGIRHVLAEQAGARVGGEVGESFFGGSNGQYAAQGVEGGAVPEGFAAGCSQQAVGSPQVGENRAWMVPSARSSMPTVSGMHIQDRRTSLPA